MMLRTSEYKMLAKNGPTRRQTSNGSVQRMYEYEASSFSFRPRAAPKYIMMKNMRKKNVVRAVETCLRNGNRFLIL